MNLDKLEEIKKEARENKVPILMDDSMELILKELDKIKPKKILEIGSAVGYSALMFSKSLDKNGYIDTIELEEKVAQIARDNIDIVKPKNIINVITGNALDVLPKLVEESKRYDVIFIDAAKGKYVEFLEYSKKLSHSGTCIIADNVLYKGRVLGDYNHHKQRTAVNKLREFLNIIQEDSELETKVYDIGDGVSISYVK